MQLLVVFGFLLATLLQVQARSIATTYEMPEVLKETMAQSFSCGMELGPQKLRGLPDVSGLLQYPEDNDALNALWGCVFKKKGIVNEDAEINEEKLEEYLWAITTMVGAASSEYKTAIHELAKDCKDVHGNGYGQTAVKIQNCAMHLATKRGLRK